MQALNSNHAQNAKTSIQFNKKRHYTISSQRDITGISYQTNTLSPRQPKHQPHQSHLAIPSNSFNPSGSATHQPSHLQAKVFKHKSVSNPNPNQPYSQVNAPNPALIIKITPHKHLTQHSQQQKNRLRIRTLISMTDCHFHQGQEQAHKNIIKNNEKNKNFKSQRSNEEDEEHFDFCNFNLNLKEGIGLSPMQSFVENGSNNKVQNIEGYYNLETPKGRIIDRYDQDEENLTSQFSAQWSRMTSIKRQTYSRLRNKFVEKFPSFRDKYSKDQLQSIEINDKLNSGKQVQQSKKIQPENNYKFVKIRASSKTENSQQKSPQKSTLRISFAESLNKTKPINPIKRAVFYSISKKKCLQNSIPDPITIKSPSSQSHLEPNSASSPPANLQDIHSRISKASYLSYLKNNPMERKKLIKNRGPASGIKAKKQNLINTREKLLELEKYGTQSYQNLKKSLDDAIEMCIREK